MEIHHPEQGEREQPLLVAGGPLYTGGHVFREGAVLVGAGGTVIASGEEGSFTVPSGSRLLDARGLRIIPGLIDLHLHGLEGHDSAGPALPEVIRALPAHGVTAFLPTSYVVPRERLLKIVGEMADVIESPPLGAVPLGIHMEGPWFAPGKSGMSNSALCYPLTIHDIEAFRRAARGHVRLVTFAPEQGEALSAIPWLVEHGIVASAGHTDADYETIRRAVALGLSHATHTYNAMRGLHHREPGTLGAVLDHDEIVAQLVGDGHHVHPAAIRVLVRAKGIERVCLVSDAAPFAGYPPGEYDWEGYHIYIDGQTSRLADGTLASAVMLMDKMLRVLVEQAGLPFEYALRTATEVPARVLGVRKGLLAPGYDADIVLLHGDYTTALTMVRGTIVYGTEPADDGVAS